MEFQSNSVTSANIDIDITSYILNDSVIKTLTEDYDFNKYINVTFEQLTGTCLYNKDKILEIINETLINKVNVLKDYIKRNYIPVINYTMLFKPNIFSLIFKDDDTIVLYNGIRINSSDYDSIKDSLKTDQAVLPQFQDFYINSILMVVRKLIDKDHSVQFNLTNIPEPIKKLFLIKCNKYKKDSPDFKKYQDIINGTEFKVQSLPSDYGMDDIGSILLEIEKSESIKKSDKELDEIHRMEVMSYLNDMEFNDYLIKLEGLNRFINMKTNDRDSFVSYTQYLMDCINTSTNRFVKYYFFNLIVSYIPYNDKVITKKFKECMLERLDELPDLQVVASAGLQLSKDILLNIDTCRAFLDKLNFS